MVDHPLGFPAPLSRKRPDPVDPYWTEPFWVSESRRRRRRLLVFGGIGLAAAVACLAAFVVVNARDNYVAGKRALASGDYALAIRRLGAAKMVGRPYADARTLLAHAVALADTQTQLTTTLRPTAVSLTLRRATSLFQAGHYAVAEKLITGVPARLPRAAVTRLTSSGNPAAAGLLMLVGAKRALAAGDPVVAGRDAATVLSLYPRCAPAKALGAEAARRLSGAPLFARATTEAAARRWSLARTDARAALRADPAYPGAAALLARIDAAIAQRKQAAKAKAAAAAAAAASSSNTRTVNPTPVKTVNPQPPPP